MTTKKVTFDPISFMYSNGGDADVASRDTACSKASKLSSHTLRQRLTRQEANPKINFFERDFPDSSECSSDDFDFPETLVERVHRLYFTRLRKQHYNEAANRALARKLICEEFGSKPVSLQESKQDEEGLSEQSISECSECLPHTPSSEDSYPTFQYFKSPSVTMSVDDAIAKEEPEPGFHPSHRCFNKLMERIVDTNTANSSTVTYAENVRKIYSGSLTPNRPLFRPLDLPSAHVTSSFTSPRVYGDDNAIEDRTDVHQAMKHWMSVEAETEPESEKHSHILDNGKHSEGKHWEHLKRREKTGRSVIGHSISKEQMWLD